MIEEMRRNVRDASLIVKNLFNQFDLHTRGCVSGEQFLRVISCHGLLSADKVTNFLLRSTNALEHPHRILDVNYIIFVLYNSKKAPKAHPSSARLHNPLFVK